MTDTITVRLGDEYERLDARLDEVVEELSDADAETQGAKLLTREARDLDQAGMGVSHLIEGDGNENNPKAGPLEEGFTGYGEDATVSFYPVTAGRQGRVRDQLDKSGGASGSGRNAFIAAHLAQAPFLNGVESADFKGKLAVVADLPDSAALWLDHCISHYGGSGNGEWTPLVQRLLIGTQGG